MVNLIDCPSGMVDAGIWIGWKKSRIFYKNSEEFSISYKFRVPITKK